MNSKLCIVQRHSLLFRHCEPQFFGGMAISSFDFYIKLLAGLINQAPTKNKSMSPPLEGNY